MDLIKEHPGPKDNGAQLKKSVEEEWRNWNSSNNENEIITHFSNPQVIATIPAAETLNTSRGKYPEDRGQLSFKLFLNILRIEDSNVWNYP